jgi:hypothetical protein
MSCHDCSLSAYILTIPTVQVTVDLAGLRQAPKTNLLIMRVLKSLGGNLSATQLLGHLSDGASVQACTLFEQGVVAEVKWSGKCGKRNTPANIHWRRKTDDGVLKCYAPVWSVQFDYAPDQTTALAEYNRYVKHQRLSRSVFSCGSGGRAYRRKVAGALWGALIAVGVVIFCMTLCCGCVTDGLSSSSSPVVYFLGFLWHVGLVVADEVTDWVQVGSMASIGSTYGVVVLGWLLFIKHWLAMTLVSIVSGSDNYVVTIPIHIVMIIIVIVLGTTTGNVMAWHGGHTFCPQDAWYLFRLMMGGSACAMVVWYVSLGYALLNLDSNSGKRMKVVLLIMEVIAEDVPQAIAQTVLWVDGSGLTSLNTFVLSITFTVVACAHHSAKLFGK